VKNSNFRDLFFMLAAVNFLTKGRRQMLEQNKTVAQGTLKD